MYLISKFDILILVYVQNVLNRMVHFHLLLTNVPLETCWYVCNMMFWEWNFHCKKDDQKNSMHFITQFRRLSTFYGHELPDTLNFETSLKSKTILRFYVSGTLHLGRVRKQTSAAFFDEIWNWSNYGPWVYQRIEEVCFSFLILVEMRSGRKQTRANFLTELRNTWCPNLFEKFWW